MVHEESINPLHEGDLLNMEYEALFSTVMLVFLVKVFVAASVVAFGPALVLDYVPARKVNVHDKADAASPAGKTQRLLLAFAGGGLMAEAALHLLPHLFAPHHADSSHDHGGHGHEGEHHKEQGLVDTFMLIAAGFLATFAIDRFGGRKADDFIPGQGGAHASKGVDVQAPVAAASDVAEATTAGAEEVKAVKDTTEPAAVEHPPSEEKQDETPEMTTVAETEEVPEEAPGVSSKEAEPTVPAAGTATEVPEVVNDTTQSATDAVAKDLPEVDTVAADASAAELPATDPQEIEPSVTDPLATDPPATDAPAADASATVPPATDSPEEATDAKADDKDNGMITKGVEGDEPDVDAPGTLSDPTLVTEKATDEGAPDATKPEGEAGADGLEDDDTAVPPKADPDPAEPELTLYGNPKTPLEPEAPAAEAKTAEEGAQDETARELKDDVPKEDEKKVEHGEADGAGHHGGHGDHHDDHGEAGGGAYATLAVDVLHNIIDGFGIGTAYAFQGTSAGHMTALLKLVHELQHEVGDVATLVQHGMSKHHAIHVQHTTAAGVFLGLAISLTAGAFPSGLLSVLLALSAGATFQLASGTILGPVLAIPAGVGGARHAFLELLAMTAGAGGVVAIGAAEKMVGLGH